MEAVYCVENGTSTDKVVALAAQSLGKSVQDPKVQEILRYLVDKNWFQTASDLRAAMSKAQQWQALEIPMRLKIAIETVLQEQQVAAVEPSLLPPTPPFPHAYSPASPAPNSPTASESAEIAFTPVVEQGTAVAYGADYNAPPPSYDEVCATATADYWNSVSQSGTLEAQTNDWYVNEYYGYEPTGDQQAQVGALESDATGQAVYDSATLTELQQDQFQIEQAEEAIFEAQVMSEELEDGGNTHQTIEGIEVQEDSSVVPQALTSSNEETLADGFGGLRVEEEDDDELVPPGPVAPPGMWTCRQCTFHNPTSESFCEMCFDHISNSMQFRLEAYAQEMPSPEPLKPWNNDGQDKTSSSLPVQVPYSPLTTSASTFQQSQAVESNDAIVMDDTLSPNDARVFNDSLGRRFTFTPSAPDYTTGDQAVEYEYERVDEQGEEEDQMNEGIGIKDEHDKRGDQPTERLASAVRSNQSPPPTVSNQSPPPTVCSSNRILLTIGTGDEPRPVELVSPIAIVVSPGKSTGLPDFRSLAFGKSSNKSMDRAELEVEDAQFNENCRTGGDFL